VTNGQGQHLGLIAVNKAFGRFAHVTGYVTVAGAAFEIAGFQTATRLPILLAIVPVLVALTFLVLLGQFHNALVSISFLIVGGVAQFSLSFALLTAFPEIESSHALAFSLVSVALVLVGSPAFTPTPTMIWGTVGFLIGQLASFIAARAAGSVYSPDAISVVVVIGLILIGVTDAITRGRRLTARQELDRAVIAEELSVLRYRIEGRAAALMHDTVLGHLSAIASGVDETLAPQLTRQIERDLAVLLGEEWLSEPILPWDDHSHPEWHQSAVLLAVLEARELSLVVDVTGDIGAISRLTPERDAAVGLAVRQCLINVVRHAEIMHAEVVIIGSEANVSVMVIDAGRGFSEHLVASDRLGLRQSVRRRIEGVSGEVRLWSTPGRGTSVLIQVPAARITGSMDD
jgi:signal transduction histidine kinase